MSARGGLTSWALVILAMASSWSALGQAPPTRHALLFGIQKYHAAITGVPELQWARADAKALVELLGPGWESRPFYDVEVNRRMIIGELTRLAGTVAQQDTVLIYFAGHGVRQTVGRHSHTYWLTYPASLSDIAVEGIRLDHLLEYIEEIPADRKIVLLDHCNSGDLVLAGPGPGASRGPNDEVTLTPVAEPRDLFPDPEIRLTPSSRSGAGIVILGAARDAAYELSNVGHGLFTHSLITAVTSPDTDTDGDHRLSLAEVWLATRLEMERVLPPGADGTPKQEPVEHISGSGLLGWTLFDAPAGADVDAESLRALITQLDANTDLGQIEDGLALGVTFQEVRSWERNTREGIEPSASSRAVVAKLRQIRSLDTIDWDSRKQMLLSVLEQQGLI